MKARACELCGGEAALFCPSDSAFLCWACDSKVHAANFLVARHVRRTICSGCGGLSHHGVSGNGFKPTIRPICRSCSPEYQGEGHDDCLSLSSSSDCISSTQSAKKIDFDCPKTNGVVSSSAISELSCENSNIPAKFSGEHSSEKAISHDRKPRTRRSRAPSNVDAKAEGILVNWHRKIGVGGGNRTVEMASHAFGACLDEFTALPLRVSLAASLWLSFRLCGDGSASTWQVLKCLEEISGVPARLILVAESKLARVLKTRRARRQQQQQQEVEEGWAEC